MMDHFVRLSGNNSENLLKHLVFGVTSNDSFGSGPSDVGLVVEPGLGKAAQS
jgi:hypothetical protein